MKTVKTNGISHHTYLVSSGKAGQGASTIAVNIAAALSLRGNRVGILDADIHFPAILRLLGAHTAAFPVQAFGIQIFAFERFVPGAQSDPVVRKKRIAGTMEQLISHIDRDHLDFLIVDLPSGDRQIQDVVVNAFAPNGAVIVTTPNEANRKDLQQHVCIFQQQGVPIIGLVENMVSWCCEKCGHVESFYTGLTDRWCQIETIAVLPMERGIWQSAQKGVPLVFDAINSDPGQTFNRIAVRLEYKHVETVS